MADKYKVIGHKNDYDKGTLPLGIIGILYDENHIRPLNSDYAYKKEGGVNIWEKITKPDIQYTSDSNEITIDNKVYILTEKPQPKFKAGDIVRVNNSNTKYMVTHIYSESNKFKVVAAQLNTISPHIMYIYDTSLTKVE